MKLKVIVHISAHRNETLLVPVAEGTTISQLCTEIERRARKIASFSGFKVGCLRYGMADGPRLDAEDEVQLVLTEGDHVFVEHGEDSQECSQGRAPPITETCVESPCGMDPTCKEAATPGTPGADSKLLAELKEMKFKTLKLTAIEIGFDENAVGNVDEADDPKQAIIDMILLKKKEMKVNTFSELQSSLEVKMALLANEEQNRVAPRVSLPDLAPMSQREHTIQQVNTFSERQSSLEVNMALLANEQNRVAPRVSLPDLAPISQREHTIQQAGHEVEKSGVAMASDGDPVEIQDISSGIIEEVMGADPVGFWEYRGDDLKFVPYSRDESKQLDMLRDSNAQSGMMEVGPNKEVVKVILDERNGKRGRQLSLKDEREIRREASAKELMQQARSVMGAAMCERPDVGVPKYTQPESILEILRRQSEPVKLVRGSWVTKYASESPSKALPRRQDLEKLGQRLFSNAFLPPAGVETQISTISKAAICLNIFSISYCWRAWDHPDKDGQQLRIIALDLKNQMSHGDWKKAKFKDAGIFWDFCSLHQKDEKGRRTREELKQFEEALANMDIWYMHALIMTFIVNGAWTNQLDIDYETRGWPHFERSCAELIKPANAGGEDFAQRMITFGQSCRKLPLSPELFAEDLAQRRFTSRGDKESVVILYTNACMLALRGTIIIDLQDIKLQRHDGRKVASVLQHCCSLEKLSLNQMDINDDESQTIAATLPRIQTLKELKMNNNKIGDVGAKALAEALLRLPSLQKFEFQHEPVTQVGKDALEQAWAIAGKHSANLYFEEVLSEDEQIYIS